MAYVMRSSDWSSDVCSSDLEQVGGQANHGVYVAVREQLGADVRFLAAAEQHTVREDDGHHAVVLQIVQPMKEEGEVGGALGRHAVVLEAHVLGHGLARLPAVAEGRIGHHRVELRFLGRVGLAQEVPVVRSEEHTSELQSLMRISYAVSCLKK